MCVVFMKYTDSFVLFQCKCNHTTDSISPRRTTAAQRGDWKTSSCSVSPRDIRGPRAVVGWEQGTLNLVAFPKHCLAPSPLVASPSVCSFSRPLTLTHSHIHIHSSLCFHTHTRSHIHSFSRAHAHMLTFSHSSSHMLSQSHTGSHTSSLTPFRPSSCPCFPLFKDRLAPPSGPPPAP